MELFFRLATRYCLFLLLAATNVAAMPPTSPASSKYSECQARKHLNSSPNGQWFAGYEGEYPRSFTLVKIDALKSVESQKLYQSHIEISEDADQRTSAFGFSSDGHLFFTFSEQMQNQGDTQDDPGFTTVNSWDLSQGEAQVQEGVELEHEPRDEEDIQDFIFTPNKEWLFTFSENSFNAWKWNNQKPTLFHHHPYRSNIIHKKLSPDGTVLIICTEEDKDDNDMPASQLWKVTHDDVRMFTSLEHFGEVHFCTFSRTNKWLATCPEEGGVVLWSLEKILEMEKGQEAVPHSLLEIDGNVHYCQFSSDDQLLVTCSTPNTRLWRMADLEQARDKQVKPEPFSTLEASTEEDIVHSHLTKDGNHLISCGGSGTLYVWKIPQNKDDEPQYLRQHSFEKEHLLHLNNNPEGKLFLRIPNNQGTITPLGLEDLINGP